MFNQNDSNAVAGVLFDISTGPSTTAAAVLWEVTKGLADVFAAQNPSFNREQFYIASGFRRN